MNLKNIAGDNCFFISDTHFGHANIIKYCNRPFSSPEEMDEEMIKRWNSVVPKDGIVFHVGDFTFKGRENIVEYRKRLNGKIYLVLGNHDREKDVKKAGFESICDLLNVIILDDEMDDGNQRVTMCHWPMISWNQSHRGAWNLFGHHHGSKVPIQWMQLDVGVDTHDFYPYTWDEVKLIITKKALAK